MSDATPVASSATPVQTPPPVVSESAPVDVVGEYRRQRLAERTGQAPASSPADQPAATAAAEPDVQAPSTDGSSEAASEPAKPSGHKGNADTRIQELLADRAAERQRAERAEFRRSQTAPTPTKPAAAAAATPDDSDPEPKIEDFENEADPYTAHVRALAKWEGRREARRIDAERQAEREAAEHRQGVQDRDRQFLSRLGSDAREAKAYLDALPETLRALEPVIYFDAQSGRVIKNPQPTGANVVAQEIVSSEHPKVFLAHFSEHPEELKRLSGLPPRLALWEMGRLEERLGKPTPPPPKPAKTVTAAPPPPPTLGSRVEEPSDDVMAEVRAGDVLGFRAKRLSKRTRNLR